MLIFKGTKETICMMGAYNFDYHKTRWTNRVLKSIGDISAVYHMEDESEPSGLEGACDWSNANLIWTTKK